MDPLFWSNDKSTGYQKENSPPGASDVHENPVAKLSIATADVLSLNNANQGQTAAFKPFQENVRKLDDNIVQQLQQPLQPRNSLIQTNKQNEKVQPELLKKFRQLRQWQQQQQESMYKQQQEQMATLKMQQEKLQLLYQKAVVTTGSPSTTANGPGDCQRTGKPSPYHIINGKEINEQKSNTSMESFFKSLKPQEKIETSLVNPAPYVGQQDIYHIQGSPPINSCAQSPVLMTPMQFMSPTSYSRPHICSPEDFGPSGPTNPLMQQNALNLSPNQALQRKIPEYEKERVFDAMSVDDQSDLESQPDDQSDCDTMSGVYPIQDDVSETCSTEIWNEQRRMDVEQEDEDEDGNSDLENTVRERVDPGHTKAEMNDEERPINPGIGAAKATTFEELLERKLSNEQNQGTQQKSPSPVKPQKKFLRKGQGLARFNMKPTNVNKQKTVNQKPSLGLPSLQQVSRMHEEERNIINNPSVRQEPKGSTKQLLAVPQNKVQRKIAGRTAPSAPSNQLPKPSSQAYGSSVLASRVIGPFSSLPYGIPITKTAGAVTKTTGAVTKTTLTSVRRDGSLLLSPLTSLDVSFEKEWEEIKEDEDLEEFEMLEQAAANASFSSNSSLVVKVLEKARTQKPGHQTAFVRKMENIITTSRDSQVPSILSPVDTGYGSGEGRGTGSIIIGSRAGSMSSVEDASTTDNESNEEEEDDDNDTTLQEIDSDDDESSSPDTDQLPPDMNQPQHGSCAPEASVQPSVPALTSPDDFDDQEAWGEIKAQTNPNDSESDEDSDDTDVTISDIFPLNTTLKSIIPRDSTNRSEYQQTSSPGNRSDVTSTPPTSALVSKLFPKLKPKPKVEENQVNNPPTVPVVTDSGPCREVQEKLKELEEEISKFRSENKALAKIRSERDEGLKRFQKEIDSFEKQKTEELERLEKFREEEMQKLRRERRTFEKYQKATRNNPDKKEREEIEALRSQVAELQEEIKRRESRWSAASSRYRSRIEALEEQNKELQEEVKLLEKYRLEKWRNDEMKAKENEEAKPRDVALRKTIKPAEPARNEALNHPLNYEVMQKEETIRQSPQYKPSSLKRHANTVIDMNNNNKTIANESTSKQSPRGKSMVDTSDAGLKQPESGELLKSKNNITGIASVIPGMKRLALQEIEHPDGKVEHVKPDGSRVIMFSNGTRKEISTDGQTIIVSFFNGDIKQVFPDQRVVYYYSDAKTTHTTYPDGLEVLQFPNNQIEKHYVDGTKEIIFPDQTIKYLYVDGTEECVFADGTIQRMRAGDGERIIEFPNGQREVHTKHYKRREYPDGTVKTVYPDGRTETRYSTGRLRVKDHDGRVLVDTAERLLQE